MSDDPLESKFIELGMNLHHLGFVIPHMDGTPEKGLTWFYRLRGSYQGNPFKLLADEIRAQSGEFGGADLILNELEKWEAVWDETRG